MSLAEIDALFAYSAEAQADLGKSYQSIFGQVIGTATMQAAEHQMLNGATLQQIEALWTEIQPSVGSTYTSYIGQPIAASSLDLGVAQATERLSDLVSLVTLTWDIPSGPSQSYTIDLASKNVIYIESWSAPSATGTLLSSTVNNSDGTSTVQSSNASDTLTSSQTWSGSNGTGSLESQTTYNSDGSSTSVTYDWDNQQAWTTSIITYNASGIPVTQTLANRDSSTTVWSYNQSGVATTAVTTQTNGSYTDTLVAPTTAGEAWQKSSYNTSKQLTETIIENTNGTWTDDKYWTANGGMEESDLHATDGSQVDTFYNPSGVGTWTNYVLTVNAAGVNQDQLIYYGNGSTADWKYDASGRAYQATQTAVDGSYKVTYFNNSISSASQWDWQQWSYNSAGVLTDQVLHNDNTTWTENKYYFVGATSTTAAYSFLIESDAHNADGTETETVNGQASDNYNHYTLLVNANGQNVTQNIVYKNGSYGTINYGNGDATSEQILQPNGTWSNTDFNGAGGIQVTNYTALGVSTSTITYNSSGSVQSLADSSGTYEQDTFSGTNTVVKTLNNTASHPESYQTRTEYWTGSTLTETVELDADGVSADVKYASDGSYTITVKDTNNTQTWSEQVQTYNSSKVETDTYDTFHDGSWIDTKYNSAGQATQIVTTNADGSYTEELFTPTGNANAIGTATYAFNSSKVEVEAAFTYYNGNVTNIDYSDSGNGNQVSEEIWDSAGDTWSYQYYADGTLETQRIDSASGAVTIDSYYDNGSKSTPGSAETVITTNADGSGQAFGYDKSGGLTTKVNQNSDGSKVVQGWDTSGTEPWTYYVVDYNSDGSVSDIQFTLKDSVQNSVTGIWSPTTTVYDSAHPTDHTVLLMTEAGLEEENAAQPANNKQDVQQRVTLPDGENYLVTVKADGSVYTKNEHGTFFDYVANDIVPIVSTIVDIVAIATQQYWIIPIVSAVDGVTELAEGNVVPGVIDLVLAAAGEAANGAVGPTGVTVGNAVQTGIAVGEGVESIVTGIQTGNFLTALTGAVQAAAAGLIGSREIGPDAITSIEVFQSVLNTSVAVANGNVVASIAAASEAIGAYYTANNTPAKATPPAPKVSSAEVGGAVIGWSRNPNALADNILINGYYYGQIMIDAQPFTITVSPGPANQNTPAPQQTNSPAPISNTTPPSSINGPFSDSIALLPLLPILLIPGVGEGAVVAVGSALAAEEGLALAEEALPIAAEGLEALEHVPFA